jgi:hypothetical protein
MAGAGRKDRGIPVNVIYTSAPHWLMFHNTPRCFPYSLFSFIYRCEESGAGNRHSLCLLPVGVSIAHEHTNAYWLKQK